MARGAPHRQVLGQQIGQVAAEAVGGDRGGVDEALGAGATAASKTLREPVRLISRLFAAAGDDDEREVDDDVGALDQLLDGLAVEDVAPPVLDLLPAGCRPDRSGAAPSQSTRSTSGSAPAPR